MGFYGCMAEPMTLAEFYADDRRRTSREASFGTAWSLDADPYVIYSVRWVEQTKEIYALRGPQAPVDASGPYFGSTAPVVLFVDEAYEVIVLGRAEDEAVLRRALEGWEAQMGRPNSLQWVRERLYDAAGRTAIN